MQTLIVLLGLGWMFCSYYFIWQTNYYASENALWTPNMADSTVVYVSSGDNTYLEEQADGAYLFYYNGIPMEVPAEDVEAGLYDVYPIVEYQEGSKNVFVEFFITIQENIENIFSD